MERRVQIIVGRGLPGIVQLLRIAYELGAEAMLEITRFGFARRKCRRHIAQESRFELDNPLGSEIRQPRVQYQWDDNPFLKMPRVAIALMCAVWTSGCPQSASAANSQSADVTTTESPVDKAHRDAAAVTERHADDEPSPGKNPFSSGGTFRSQRWTLGGLYAGAHVAYNFGNACTQQLNLSGETSSSGFGSLYGGLQVGYLLPLRSRLLVGVETDVSFPN